MIPLPQGADLPDLFIDLQALVDESASEHAAQMASASVAEQLAHVTGVGEHLAPEAAVPDVARASVVDDPVGGAEQSAPPTNHPVR